MFLFVAMPDCLGLFRRVRDTDTSSGITPEEEFVNAQRNKWAFENRPCEHPFDCDFRDALGLPSGLIFNSADVLHQFDLG